MPLARALMVHFPDEKEAWAIDDQWLLGPDVLVAPVMDAGVSSRELWLPPSEQPWMHLWSRQTFSGGQRVTVEAPIGEPPVFIQTSGLVISFLSQLKQRGVL